MRPTPLPGPHLHGSRPDPWTPKNAYSVRTHARAVERAYATLITAADSGDADAARTLFAALYDDLHRLARRELARNGQHAPLGATTLLHEAYLDVAERDGLDFAERGRFLAYAARVMRGLIVDHSRRQHAAKRGGRVDLTTLDTGVQGLLAVADAPDLDALSHAVDTLALADPTLAEVVDLKFFGGFSFIEIAAMRSVSERTVQRQWEKARLYLFHALRVSPDA